MVCIAVRTWPAELSIGSSVLRNVLVNELLKKSYTNEQLLTEMLSENLRIPSFLKRGSLSEKDFVANFP